METSYLIEDLVLTFAKHADDLDEMQKNNIESFKKSYPGSDLPLHLENPFNLSRALSEMASEIVNIKYKSSCQ